MGGHGIARRLLFILWGLYGVMGRHRVIWGKSCPGEVLAFFRIRPNSGKFPCSGWQIPFQAERSAGFIFSSPCLSAAFVFPLCGPRGTTGPFIRNPNPIPLQITPHITRNGRNRPQRKGFWPCKGRRSITHKHPGFLATQKGNQGLPVPFSKCSIFSPHFSTQNIICSFLVLRITLTDDLNVFPLF